jgi:D-ribose pyranase
MQVFAALKENFEYGHVWVAEEFKSNNSAEKLAELQAQVGATLNFESHVALKERVPGAIGLIRTGDTTQYANMIIKSA